MRLFGLTIGLLVVGLLVAPASAVSVTQATLADLDNDALGLSIISGDKIISDFDVTSNVKKLNGVVVGQLDLTQVLITAFHDTSSDEYGISIGLGGTMDILGGPIAYNDLGFRYVITAGPGKLIHDNTMTMAGGALNGGDILISETPYDDVTGDQLTSKLVFDFNGSNGVTNVHKEYHYANGQPAAVKVVDVTKDIETFTTIQGSIVQLSDVTQTFSQTAVPEPVTMFSAFMAISGLGMYIRKRMKVQA